MSVSRFLAFVGPDGEGKKVSEDKKIAATGHTHTAFPGKADAASGTRLDSERPRAKAQGSNC